MTTVYSTAELIQILAEERRACMSGQRFNLTASPSGFSPVLDLFLQADGIQKFTAYNDFRAAVHHYQREHQVSGMIWQTLTLQGQTLCYPRVHDQLIGLPDDLQQLRSARDAIVQFWRDNTVGMDLFLGMNGGKLHQPIMLADVERIVQRTEWANLSQQGHANTLEIILQIGWGQPEEAAYQRGGADSGSEYVHAVHPGQHPIG